MERRKTSLLILGVCAFILSVVGVTYAFWELRLSQTEENKIASSCFKVTLEEEGIGIHLEKAYPILDSEGVALEPYTFTVTNVCDTYAGYQINLESLSKNNGILIQESNRLDATYLKVKINEVETEGIISKLGDNDLVTQTLSDAYESHKLMTGYLEPNKSKNFEFRLWLDGALTINDKDAMNKTFASKITVTASYLPEDKIPPTTDVTLAVCENTVTATGSGIAFGDKRITKYEFQLDGDAWTDITGSLTKEFSDLPKGSHTIRFRVTDDKGATSEAVKHVEIGEPETVNIYGKDIPITTCNNGLYEVEHKDAEAQKMDTKWQETEYRFAGVDYNKDSPDTPYVHNYLWFNSDDGCTSEEDSDKHCELWRIIGLVNVKVIKEDGSETIEQRLKIVRDKKLEKDMPWDSSHENDWTQATLMEMLNGDYFEGSSKDVEGLSGTAEDMIDKEIIWNIGGSSTYNDVTVDMFYNRERGETVPSGRLPEWRASNTKDSTGEAQSELFHSIALPYPSDYAYATNGGTLGREECFKKELYNWDGGQYKTQCAQTDWLKPESGYMWLLSPNSSYSYSAFFVTSGGSVGSGYVDYSYGVWPALYLSSKVTISSGTGSWNEPYTLSY